MTVTPNMRAQIILDYENGIEHAEYYVIKTKTGVTQVRRRKHPVEQAPQTPAPVQTESPPKSEPESTLPSASPPPENKKQKKPEPELEHEPMKKQKPKKDYDAITNKQLMEKMVAILEQNVVSRDLNNAVENERKTEENKRFIEEVKPKPQPVQQPIKRRLRGRLL